MFLRKTKQKIADLESLIDKKNESIKELVIKNKSILELLYKERTENDRLRGLLPDRDKKGRFCYKEKKLKEITKQIEQL